MRSTQTVKFLLIFSFFILIKSQDCNLLKVEEILIPFKGINITHPKEYPVLEPGMCLDKIWSISQNVEFKVHSLQIDGQSGDFVIVSSNPPLMQNIEIGSIQKLLPIANFQLLSWKKKNDNGTRISVLSPSGAFLYFHGERGDGSRTKFQEGFRIELLPFDKTGPILPPTTANPLPTPDPSDEVFVIRFVTGKHPLEFVATLDQFKEKVAEMATSYCEDEKIIIPERITPNYVIVPRHKIHYCDDKWTVYQECTEIAFAIAVVDDQEKYVMTKQRINEMWNKYNSFIEDIGLKEFTPPESNPELVPWIWIAATFGVFVFFSIGLCVVWLRSDDIASDAPRTAVFETTNVDEENQFVPFYDLKNPISDVVKKISDRKSESPPTSVELRERHKMYRQNDQFLGFERPRQLDDTSF